MSSQVGRLGDVHQQCQRDAQPRRVGASPPGVGMSVNGRVVRTVRVVVSSPVYTRTVPLDSAPSPLSCLVTSPRTSYTPLNVVVIVAICLHVAIDTLVLPASLPSRCPVLAVPDKSKLSFRSVDVSHQLHPLSFVTNLYCISQSRLWVTATFDLSHIHRGIPTRSRCTKGPR